MWVLFLAVASIFAFLSITLLLWLADALETRASRPQRKYNIGSPFIVISIAQAFEPGICTSVGSPDSCTGISPSRRGTRHSRFPLTAHFQ